MRVYAFIMWAYTRLSSTFVCTLEIPLGTTFTDPERRLRSHFRTGALTRDRAMTAQPRSERHRCSCLALRQAARRITQFYDQHLAGAGLRVTQFSILVTLHDFGPRSITELAAEMGLDRTTLGRNLRPLEREGLVAITVDPRDRRGRALALTDEGMARLRRAAHLWRDAQTRFEQTYGTADTEALHRMLDAVSTADLGAMDQRAAGAA